jgi:hypothetical protein
MELAAADFLFYSKHHSGINDLPLCGRDDEDEPLYRSVLDVDVIGETYLLVHTEPATLVDLLAPGSRIQLRHRPSVAPDFAQDARARREAFLSGSALSSNLTEGRAYCSYACAS